MQQRISYLLSKLLTIIRKSPTFWMLFFPCFVFLLEQISNIFLGETKFYFYTELFLWHFDWETKVNIGFQETKLKTEKNNSRQNFESPHCTTTPTYFYLCLSLYLSFCFSCCLVSSENLCSTFLCRFGLAQRKTKKNHVWEFACFWHM